MEMLPKWVLPPTLPSIYESESFTSLEMVAKLYGAVNALIGEYNNLENDMSSFSKTEEEKREEFETKLTKVVREFICSWEKKTADLELLAETVVSEAIRDGKIEMTESYDPETESLNIIAGGEL